MDRRRLSIDTEWGTRMTTDAPKLLLTAKEAAQSLAISERTLWELTRRGEIPRLKIGASVRYDLRDLQAWIDKKKGGAV